MNYERVVSAKSLILDVLRASRTTVWSVRKLVEFASLFDLSENSIRVTLSRLVSADLVETDVRGYYRMSVNSEAIGEWIDFWMQGEQRVKEWQGDWLVLLSKRPLKKAECQQLDIVANRFGFRMVDSYWIRANNLVMTIDVIRDLIICSSNIPELSFLQMTSAFDSSGEIDFTKLWSRNTLEKSYHHCDKLLQQSMLRFPAGDHTNTLAALKESFLLGGHAINMLVLDPLLPASMVDVSARAKLTETMLAYNEHFHETWLHFFETKTFDKIPSHNS